MSDRRNFPRRKIIQITSQSDTDEKVAAVTALCDDGTVWQIYFKNNLWSDWEKLPKIPQREES